MDVNNDKRWAVLSEVNLVLLDNSLRETVVGNTRAQTVQQKMKIFELIVSTGLREMILGSFGRHPRTDDYFIEFLHTEGLINEGHYIFSELFDQEVDGVPSAAKPRGLRIAEDYGIRNLVVEFDVNTPNFQRWGGSRTIKELCELRSLEFNQLTKARNLFFNIRDFTSAMKNCAGETLDIVEHLARIPEAMRPRGLLVEDPTGETFPHVFGEWIRQVKQVATSGGWAKFELLVHVHKGFGLSEAITLEAISNGATGVWAGLCDTGVGVGHNASLMTLMNLARLGNHNVLERFNLPIMRKVAQEIYQMTTNASIPDTAELFSDRAFEMIFNGGFGHEHTLARIFSGHTRYRISELADGNMIHQRLIELNNDYPWNTRVASLMALEIQVYLNYNANLDLNSPPSLVLRYLTAGGKVTNGLIDMVLQNEGGSVARSRWQIFRSLVVQGDAPPILNAHYLMSVADHRAPEHWNFQLDQKSSLAVEQLYNNAKSIAERAERNELIGSLWTWAIINRFGEQTDESLETYFFSQMIVPEVLRYSGSSPSSSVQMASIDEPRLGANHPLLFSLPASVRERVFEDVKSVTYSAGTVIFRIFDQGTTFYRVISGRLGIYKDANCNEELNVLKKGSFIGELAAFTGKPRTASVKALDDSVLLSIPSPLEQLGPEERRDFHNQINGILQIYETWYNSENFRDLAMRDFLAMLKFAEFVDVPTGTRLVKRGTAPSSLYITIDGEVEVNIHGKENVRLFAGDVFGEQSILKKTTANSDVVTSMACRFAKFTREGMQDLIASDETIAKIFQDIVNTRSRRL